LDQLANEEFYEANKDNMLAAHESNKLIAESDVEMHGATYHRMRFDTHNEKWGKRMCVDVHSRRTGRWSIGIQWAFPCDGRISEELQPPDRIQDLLAKAKVFEDTANE
jgi:hypothetical protein